MKAKRAPPPDRFEIAERYGGPDYGVDGARVIAARFALANRGEFVAWLESHGIAPPEALAWAGQMSALHRLALRGLGRMPGATDGSDNPDDPPKTRRHSP